MNKPGSPGRSPLKKRGAVGAGESSQRGKKVAPPPPSPGSRKLLAGESSPAGKQAAPPLEQVLSSARKNFLFSTDQVPVESVCFCTEFTITGRLIPPPPPNSCSLICFFLPFISQ